MALNRRVIIIALTITNRPLFALPYKGRLMLLDCRTRTTVHWSIANRKSSSSSSSSLRRADIAERANIERINVIIILATTIL